jgi:GcrA cell cycle regulator
MTKDAEVQAWTEDRVELLKKLWADGLSASQIAGQLGGVTRNAVIGKVHRLGLSGRTKTVSSVQRVARPKPSRPMPPPRPQSQPMSIGATALKAQPRPEADAAPMAAPAPAIPFPMPDAGARVTILQLNERTCRWPEGDPARDDFKFCGAASEVGVPYCPYHCAIAYQPSQERRRDKKVVNG